MSGMVILNSCLKTIDWTELVQKGNEQIVLTNKNSLFKVTIDGLEDITSIPQILGDLDWKICRYCQGIIELYHFDRNIRYKLYYDEQTKHWFFDDLDSRMFQMFQKTENEPAVLLERELKNKLRALPICDADCVFIMNKGV